MTDLQKFEELENLLNLLKIEIHRLGDKTCKFINNPGFKQPEDKEQILAYEKIGDVYIVDSEGGKEGDGTYMHVIYHFESLGLYIKIEGHYDSWDSNQYGELQLVYPNIIPKIEYISTKYNEGESDFKYNYLKTLLK